MVEGVIYELEESGIPLWLESVLQRNCGTMVIYWWTRLCYLPEFQKYFG